MFTAHDLLFVYPGSKPARPPLNLRGLRLPFPSGGKVALLGESGSGKSTLLNLLGLLWDRPPTSGSVEYHGPARDDPQRRREQSRLRREDFGFVFQSSYLLPHFTVAQNIAVPLELAGLDAAEIARRVGGLLEEARMPELATRVARRLSGGQRQRVAILRAIAHDPLVVFADEPASNLDRHHAEVVLELLDRWHKGKLPYQSPRDGRTLFFVSHSLRQVRRIEADHVVLLFDGRVVGNQVYPLAALDDESIYQAIEQDRVPRTADVEINGSGVIT